MARLFPTPRLGHAPLVLAALIARCGESTDTALRDLVAARAEIAAAQAYADASAQP